MNYYLGVTGFTSKKQVCDVLENVSSNYTLMIGVLLTEKTMYGIEMKNNPKRYPKMGKISSIFPSKMENVLRLIHYSQKEANAFESMNNVAEVVGSDFFDGFQLNMAWPKLDSIIEYKRKYPEHKIVLQVGTRSFTYFNEDMERVAKEIQRYDPFVDYILFDFSGGKGILMDSRFVSMNISRIVNKYNIQQNKIVIAGGISPDNMEEIIIPILREFPFIGIDSESRLRNNEDDLDISLVREYLSKFEELKQRIRTK